MKFAPPPGARNTLGILSEGHGAKVCGSHNEFHLRADRPDALGVSLLSTSPPGISEGRVDNECLSCQEIGTAIYSGEALGDGNAR